MRQLLSILYHRRAYSKLHQYARQLREVVLYWERPALESSRQSTPSVGRGPFPSSWESMSATSSSCSTHWPLDAHMCTQYLSPFIPNIPARHGQCKWEQPWE